MKKIIVVILLTLAIVSPCAAATWTTDGSHDNVVAAIAAASPGDTINLPAGTFAWTSAAAVTKQLTIHGEGPASTILQRSAGSFFTVDITASFQITGIHFEGSGTAGDFIYITNKSTGFRINNNRFNNTTTASRVGVSFYVSAMSEGQPTGVIDNNTFNNSRVYVTGPTTTPYAGTFTGPSRLGTDNTVYIENNTIDRTGYCSTGAAGNAVDSQYGMSYVFRFNNVIDANLEVHSTQTGDLPARGGRYWEMYNNTFSKPTATCWNRAIFIRGGTGVVFNNSITGNGYDAPQIDLDGHAARDGSCNGSSTADGNTVGQAGWPCRDQIGRATDAFLWTNGGAVPSQASEPAYFWGNAGFSNTSVAAADAAHIVQDRDYYEDDTAGMSSGAYASIPGSCTVGQGYWATDQSTLYKCTATDTWTSYYIPYTCPHPATGLAAGCDANTAGIEGYGVPAGPDTRPAVFAFTDNVDVARSTVIYSDSIQVLAIDNDTTISIAGAGCEYQVNGTGSWLTSGDNVVLLDNVTMRRTSDASYSTDRTCDLILGGTVSDTWHVTTIAASQVYTPPLPSKMRAHYRQRPASTPPPDPPADPGYVGHIAPTAAQSVSESPYSNNGWTNPTYVYLAGEASITAATFDAGDKSYVLKAYGFDFSAIPVGAIIDGVEVIVNARYGTAVVSISLAQLLDTARAKVGTNLASSPQDLTTSAANYTYGGAANKWGNTLTRAWVQDADFGVALGFTAGSTGNSNNKVYVDSVTMKVWYTP